jgi:hypothetical protein
MHLLADSLGNEELSKESEAFWVRMKLEIYRVGQ